MATDPRSGVVYETEDAGNGLIYRYIPHAKGLLGKGGRLQALAVRDIPSLDTRNWDPTPAVLVGEKLDTHWIDLENVESPNNDLRFQGFSKGAARFARGEGMWYGFDAVYFACTSGGFATKGQVWRYTPSPFEATNREVVDPGKLELFIEPNDGGLVENCDNVTVTPWGDLILCEDGPGGDFLVGVTRDGEIYKFARNATKASEFAGATFSPDATTLFVNIQSRGITLAITGPWNSRRTKNRHSSFGLY